MAEDRQPGYFDGLEAKHRRRVLLWGGIGITLLAAGLAFALLRLPAGESPKPSPTPIETPTATPEATGTAAPSEGTSADPGTAEPAEGTGGGTTGGSPTTGGTGGFSEKPPASETYYTAYRLDGSIWVAAVGGADPRKVVAESGVSSFEVSPNGKTLALARRDGLELRDVASGSTRRVMKSATGAISWSHDSERFAFASAGSSGDWEIRVVAADGTGLKKLATGALPKMSPDGKRVAFMTGAMEGGKPVSVVAVSGGSVREVAGTANTLDFDWADDETIVALVGKAAAGDAPASVTIRRATLAGKRTDVSSSVVTAPIVTWMYLHASPDGRSLLYAEVGDDGYSRAHVLGPDGKLIDLGTRRDTYPVGWAGDGKVLFVEGNSFQGEDTDLMWAKADGSGRRLVARGASR